MHAPERFPAVVVDHERGEPVALRDFPSSDLKGELLLEVLWSSLNYKDALASRPDGQVARTSPLVLGVDHVGVVRESGDARYSEGDVVIAHGSDLGALHHGGLAAWSRVSADWVVPLPASLTPRQTMILGTAGYTAGASVLALERHGLTPDDGPVLVTAGTGGVGSAAIAMLTAHGYTVHASTGKPDAADWLRTLGASAVVDREAVTAHAARPLARQLWAATIDSVGGATLAGALSATRYGGAIAASGLTGDAHLETTVMPFILRHVSLLGIDSSATRAAPRQAIWERLATDLRPADLELLVRSEIGLDDVLPAFDELLAGGARGRYLVRLAG
jgi:putative YhdH/YhfP family quinone oxidoreductase